MQRKLATWTTADPTRRVDRLLRLIAQPDWLAEAARFTLSSKGANTPGIDGEIKPVLLPHPFLVVVESLSYRLSNFFFVEDIFQSSFDSFLRLFLSNFFWQDNAPDSFISGTKRDGQSTPDWTEGSV